LIAAGGKGFNQLAHDSAIPLENDVGWQLEFSFDYNRK